MVPRLEVDVGGYKVESIAPSQILTYPYYPLQYSYYFIEIMFLMLFLLLPMIIFIPVIKALVGGLAG